MKIVKFLASIITILSLIPFTAKAGVLDFYNALSGMQAVKDVANTQPVILNPEIKQNLRKFTLKLKILLL